MIRKPQITCTADVVGADAFASLGRVEIVPPGELQAHHLKNAVALVTRSSVRVAAHILQGSSVRFVGTATAGHDHLDIEFLRRSGIRWCAAPGCNREAVADYVTAVYFQWLAEEAPRIRRLPQVAIIGYGHTGRSVAKRLRRIGVQVACYDPPKQRRGVRGLVSLSQALAPAEVITLHVPLTRRGAYPTESMVDRDFLNRAPRLRLLINTARGSVLGPDIGQYASAIGFALDVWWWEDPDGGGQSREYRLPELVFASPHIAGRTAEGMYRGTLMVYRKLCRFLGREPVWRPPQLEAPPPLRLNGRGKTDIEVVAEVTRMVLDLPRLTRDFRCMLTDVSVVKPDAAFMARWTGYRRHWAVPRRDFRAYTVQVRNISVRAAQWLQALGFQVSS